MSLPTEITTAIESHLEARKSADAAFGRYFAKRQAGERTSGSAWQRLENVANERWTEVHNAISRHAATIDDGIWLDPDVADYL